jgi:signal transduction histidine kinase/DNA-binding NarL/FixJ family response regulator
MGKPARQGLLSKILLVFALLIAFIVANGVYSTWRWHTGAMRRLDADLDAKLDLAQAMLHNELDKFALSARVLHEQNSRLVDLFEYDNYRAMNILLQNAAQLYDIDLLLFFDAERLVAGSEILPDKAPLPAPGFMRVHLKPGLSLEALPASLFKHVPAGTPPTVLCLKAVVPLHYEVGDLAGHILVLKVLNWHRALVDDTARLGGAEIILYDWQQHTVLSSFHGPLPGYSADRENLRYQGQDYRVKLARLDNAYRQMIGELAVVLDSRPFALERRRLIVDNLVPFVLTLLVSIFLLALLKLKIFNRIAQLIQVLREVAGGDLRRRLPVADHGSADEMMQMGANFNRMMERLEHSYGEVENSRRTLEQLNRQLRQEINEREKAELALRGAKHEAEAANRAKSMFLANMSHEIRTPLNAVLGYAQWLQRDGGLSEAQRRAVDTIGRSGGHLLELINDVLDLSKIEAGRMELKPLDFDLAGLAQDLSGLFRHRCAEKHLDWRVEFPADGPLPVHGDSGKLRQVLINLLGNAVKFTDHGWVSLRVTAGANASYTFEVADSGPGIVAAAQDKIFEAFQQDSEGQQKGGTGLGLAISRKHVALMGGELRLASTPGQGACFFFSLPLPPARETLRPRSAPPGEVLGLAPGQSVSALVVDDVAVNREVLSKLLQAVGVSVSEADSGEAALRQARETPFDIVFMDYRLPGMNGLQAMREIVRSSGGRCRTVIVSASTFSHESGQFAQADDFLGKPFRADELYACMGRLLGLEYRYRESPATATETGGSRVLRLPAALLAELREAAEFCMITRLEEALARLAEQGEGPARLAAELKALAGAYRMEKISECLNEVRVDETV